MIKLIEQKCPECGIDINKWNQEHCKTEVTAYTDIPNFKLPDAFYVQ